MNNFYKNKKAQLKIQQMAFMLMAVVMFFALVGIFVMVFKVSDLKKSAEILEEENALLLVTRLANSPELSCGGVFDNTAINCVDFDKMIVLKNNAEKYSGFWGKDITNIEIRKILYEQEIICNSENYQDCNVLRIYPKKQGYSVSNFVSLCRKDLLEREFYNKCELAKLLVTYDVK